MAINLLKVEHNLSPDNVRQDVKWTNCFLPLDFRVSLNFAHICEQLFKAKFQAMLAIPAKNEK